MVMKKRCALLDTDFISKLYITEAGDSDRLIDRLLKIDSFRFVCHNQTYSELACHNQVIAAWLKENHTIPLYTDRQLLQLVIKTFGAAAYGLFLQMLFQSCSLFSPKYFHSNYSELETYVTDHWGNYDLDHFISLLTLGDSRAGLRHNLGEIKIYTMAQVLSRTGEETVYLFCSDDRKARYALSVQTGMECVSAFASFYLLKKYLHMTKTDAQPFLTSWLAYHKKYHQNYFPVYAASGHQLNRLSGQELFELLYNEKLDLMKDGYFRLKEN